MRVHSDWKRRGARIRAGHRLVDRASARGADGGSCCDVVRDDEKGERASAHVHAKWAHGNATEHVSCEPADQRNVEDSGLAHEARLEAIPEQHERAGTYRLSDMVRVRRGAHQHENVQPRHVVCDDTDRAGRTGNAVANIDVPEAEGEQCGP